MLGIMGYWDRFSARPGEAPELKVSIEDGSPNFRVELVRLICGDDGPDRPGFKAESITSEVNGVRRGRQQATHAGSYVHIPSLRAIRGEAVTLAALVMPTWIGKRANQCIFSRQHRSSKGVALIMDASGCGGLWLHDGNNQVFVTCSTAMREGSWYLLVASFNASNGTARVLQRPIGGHHRLERDVKEDRSVELQMPSLPAGAALIAARHDPVDGIVDHFDGRIEAPALYSGALETDQFSGLVHPFDIDLPALGGWNFSRHIGSADIADVSGNDSHGRCINLPTRAVTGHAWRGQTVDWRARPDLYGAIHFHCDDLEDCSWNTDVVWQVPSAIRSGIYAARLTTDQGAEDFVPLFILPPKGNTTAPLAFLASTFTYLAYANSHHGYEDPLSEPAYGALLVLDRTDLFLKERRDLGVSLYDRHRDGSGSCYSSAKRPILNMRPKHRIWNFNADLHVIDWLEESGIEYDVITDDVLHEEGAGLLSGYRCLMAGTHPEYHTTRTLDAVEEWLGNGGRLIYMGGNGFYWKVATHENHLGVIEVRRGEAGTRCFEMPPGERHHQFDGEFGGLWRSNGRAPQQLVGVGFVAEGFDSCQWYHRESGSFDPRVAFIFEGVGKDDRIGAFGILGGAAGLELDATDPTLGTPAHALVLARSAGHSNVYLVTVEEMMSTHPSADGLDNPLVRAELVFFETPAGGAVFSTGSIAWAASLCHNGYSNNVAQIIGNVVRRFLDPAPFEWPDKA
ncbi:N,N-dimethylformamidase beta subunit family domain-containing protein [Dongia deserti]|uniref:N,N-dimethylformamidase beta subunit family domain-containing protein n=1 Tax=Dongia deserti TaxID=2268030 RepID=UPI000E648F67|nr:N,N-dimethylformamidase beta subunit family domain-containing protein [Dongia deserti]